MELPPEIKVGYRSYAMGRPHDAVSQDGAHMADPPTMLIREAKTGVIEAHTFIHEIGHAFWEVYGAPPKDEEAFCDWLAGAVVSLGVDNVNAMAYFMHLVRKK